MAGGGFPGFLAHCSLLLTLVRFHRGSFLPREEGKKIKYISRRRAGGGVQASFSLPVGAAHGAWLLCVSSLGELAWGTSSHAFGSEPNLLKRRGFHSERGGLGVMGGSWESCLCLLVFVSSKWQSFVHALVSFQAMHLFLFLPLFCKVNQRQPNGLTSTSGWRVCLKKCLFLRAWAREGTRSRGGFY